jgi:Tfp pilus assembly protein PilN
MRTNINLLPHSFRRQQMIRTRVIQWSMAMCGVLIAGWIIHCFELSERRALSQDLEVLAREHQPTQTMLRQLVDMRQQLKDLQQQEAIAVQLEQQRNALALFGVISRTAKNTNGRLRITRLELTNFQGHQSAATGQPGGLLLAGVSLDNPAVGELLDGLQDSGVFRLVELMALKERPHDDQSLRDYEVRCEF